MQRSFTFKSAERRLVSGIVELSAAEMALFFYRPALGSARAVLMRALSAAERSRWLVTSLYQVCCGPLQSPIPSPVIAPTRKRSGRSTRSPGQDNI